MAKRQNIIELNGKRYDALTGLVVAPAQPTTSGRKPAKSKGKAIDGVISKSVSKQPLKKPVKHAVAKPKPRASHEVHARTTRSKTLMRRSVPKPTPPQTAKTKKPAKQLAPGDRATAERLKRAQQISQSRMISRFGSRKSAVAKTVATIDVRQAPASAKPVERPAIPVLTSHTLDLNPFEAALRHATGHQQPKLKKPKLRHRAARKLKVSPRALNAGAGVIVALIVGAFVAYRSLPTWSVNLAASRAGVQAALPGYQPAGFSLAGPVHYSTGQITIGYKSNSDDRAFQLIQRNSDWTSQSLRDNFVASRDGAFQTVQQDGKTIFIYDHDNATWVSGGVWYQIEGKSSLNSDQLLKIASSL